MEWDKFWSTNKKKYEQTAHRYMGVFKESCVELHIDGAPEGEIVSIPVQLHPKVKKQEDIKDKRLKLDELRPESGKT